MGALSGVTVLDLGTYIAGPYCATVLGEFGADVIKVERPGAGDNLRRFGTDTECGDTLVWLSESRNKRSVTIDLGAERGRGCCASSSPEPTSWWRTSGPESSRSGASGTNR